MTVRPKLATIDEYLETVPAESRAVLQQIRRRVQALVPEAEETISYGMPAFRLKKVFFFFAAFKKHIGIYPPVQDPALVEELAPYRGPKGNLSFPLDEPIPHELIGRVAVALARESSSR